jgi:hypothetical protein
MHLLDPANGVRPEANPKQVYNMSRLFCITVERVCGNKTVNLKMKSTWNFLNKTQFLALSLAQ